MRQSCGLQGVLFWWLLGLRFNRFVKLCARSAAILSVLACMEFASAAVIDQTPSIGASFAAFWTAARNRPFEDQEAIWDKVVERPRQDLYASVVWEIGENLHWQEGKERLLRQRFLEYPSVSGQIPAAARRLESDISVQVSRFRGLFPDAAARPSIQLVLAPNPAGTCTQFRCEERCTREWNSCSRLCSRFADPRARRYERHLPA